MLFLPLVLTLLVVHPRDVNIAIVSAAIVCFTLKDSGSITLPSYDGAATAVPLWVVQCIHLVF